MWSSTPSLQKLTKENQKPQFGPPLIQNREQQILYSGHHRSLVHLQQERAAPSPCPVLKWTGRLAHLTPHAVALKMVEIARRLP